MPLYGAKSGPRYVILITAKGVYLACRAKFVRFTVRSNFKLIEL